MTVVGVTGAGGFVGQRVISRIESAGIEALPLLRTMRLDGLPEWIIARPVDVIIHTAARVHVMDDKAADPLAAFRKVNVEGTMNLAHCAIEAGVKRLVFVSSVKVNGEVTAGKAFSSVDIPAPSDPYGVSKWEAEQGLLELARRFGLEVAIVRPPLVYGPGVRANFLRLMKLVKTQIPLPCGSIHNLRSMIGVDNLADLLFVAATHAAAPGGTFMASDDRDVSTSELLRMLAAAMDKRSVLLPCAPALLSAVARCVGLGSAAARLLDSLQVDISDTKSRLDWRPPIGMDEAIGATVAFFLKTH